MVFLLTGRRKRQEGSVASLNGVSREFSAYGPDRSGAEGATDVVVGCFRIKEKGGTCAIPNCPVYGDGYDIVSLCVDKHLVATLDRERLGALCAKYAGLFLEKRLLRAEDIQALSAAVDTLHKQWKGSPLVHPAVAERIRLLESHVDQAAYFDLLKDSPSASLSPWHFIRRFKKDVGLTPHRYLMQRRLRHAQHLLLTGPSVADVAALAGFCDQSHLDRAFRRALGITPQEYRASCELLRDDATGQS